MHIRYIQLYTVEHLTKEDLEMKTKHYEFTEIEILVIRESLTEYWHNTLKRSLANSPITKNMQNACKALKDQFIQDYRRI